MTTTHYTTILMNHLEHVHIEVVAAMEMVVEKSKRFQMEASDTVDCNRMLLVTEGTGKLRIGSSEWVLRPGMFGVVLSGIDHKLETKRGDGLVVKWFQFRAGHADRDLYRLLGLPETVDVGLNEAERLFDTVIKHAVKPGLTSKLRSKAAVLNLIALYLEHVTMTDMNGYDEPLTEEIAKMDTVLRYINDHLADNITVEELSRLVYLHPNYFIVFFKGKMGCSPIQYVNQRRIEVAREMLMQPERNVSDVAGRVGMKIHYFSRMFKSYTGLSPSQFRRMALRQAASPGIVALAEAMTASAAEEDGRDTECGDAGGRDAVRGAGDGGGGESSDTEEKGR